MTGTDMNATHDAFVAQCEADYNIAEITSVAHLAPGASKPTHLLAVVELLHEGLEPNPLIGSDPNSGGYPRRFDISSRAGKLFVQRWHVSVREGVQWYRDCASGSMLVPSMNPLKPTVVQLCQLADDPTWPCTVVEVERFWQGSEFWGRRPGGSRWHRLLPIEAVSITNGWQSSDFERARDFLMSEIHVDILSRSVLIGSCHLCLPNPIFIDLRQHPGKDWKSISFDLHVNSGKVLDGLELTVWNRRSWGATSVRHIGMKPGVNVLHFPEGVEQTAHSVFCPKRGLMMQSDLTGFIRAISTSMHLVSEQRHVETPKGSYSVGVSGMPERVQVGEVRPAGALARLAADEGQQRAHNAWKATMFQWFDKDSVAGAQAIQNIIQSATNSVDLLDPYFGRGDLLEFALATTKHGLPFRVLTSHDFCTSGEDLDLKVERGDALAKTLESVRAQDPRLDIEIKVMPGQKSPVHDRFLIVDGIVWVLGASLNEFGSRGSLLMRLPASSYPGVSDSFTFSVSEQIFDANWESSHSLSDWVNQRALSRARLLEQRQSTTFKSRVISTKDVVINALRRIMGVWRA
jgi:hypothetical protein